MKKVAAVIVAGGTGSRMQTKVKKQYLKIENKEVVAHTVEVFEAMEAIDEVIVVTGLDDVENVKEMLCNQYEYTKVKRVVAGGVERQDSVYNGLKEVSEDITYIVIHDGARPLIKEETIWEALNMSFEKGACIVAVPVKDTIKRVKESGIVEDTPDRKTLWAVQTPQVFRKDLILRAYQHGKENALQVTDDSMLVEALGQEVYVVEGDYTNIKLTTPDDLEIAKQILEARNRG